MAPIRDGTYEVVQGVVRAFHGETRERIERFLEVAKAVQSGSTNQLEAQRQVEELGSTLATIWNTLNNHSGALGLLLTILALYLTLSGSHDADASAAKLQSATEKQLQIEQQILQELRKQSALAQSRGRQSAATLNGQTPIPPQKPVTVRPANRHERRKAAAKRRYQPPS